MPKLNLSIFGCIAALVVASCSSSQTTPQVSSALGFGGGIATSASIVGDDWVTYAHDQLRSGEQSQQLGLTASGLQGIKLRWKFSAADQVYATPLVYGGLVIVCTANRGIVYALDSSTGKVVWQRNLGGQIRLTPSIADGQVFIGTHLFTTDANGNYLPSPSAFFSLDLLTGAIRWQKQLVGTARSEPVVVGGHVIIGIAGGDLPSCINGGVDALDEDSGALAWSWKVNPVTLGGGSSWGPISYDGNRIFLGTGNTCNSPVMTSNSTVALNPSTGKLEWTLVEQQNSLEDDDTGGGVLLANNMAFDISKNGMFYAMDASSGELAFSKQLNIDTLGGWATPTTDGNTILISGGQYVASSSTSGAMDSTTLASNAQDFFTVRRQLQDSSGQTGKIFALDYGGATKWTLETANPVFSYLAIAGAFAFANLDGALVAIDLSTGAKVWQYPLATTSQGGDAVVPSGIYTADDNGGVYAFSYADSTTASARRR